MSAIAPEAPVDRDVSSFLESLRGHGFQVGVRDFIHAQQLFVVLAARGDLPAGIRERLALLRPLVCRTPEQQHCFAGLVDLFARPAETGQGGAGDEGGDTRQWWLVALAFVISTLAVAGFLIFKMKPGPVVDEPPPRVESGIPAPTPKSAPPPKQIPNPKAERLDRALAVAAWGAVAMLAALLAYVMTRRIALQTLRTDVPLDQRSLFTTRTSLLQPPPELRRTSRELRWPLSSERRELDIPATLRATVDAGGAFSPRVRLRRRTPEYVVLVDRRGPYDQLARIAFDLCASLDRLGVAIDQFEFNGDIAFCERASRSAHLPVQRISFAGLAARHSGQRLLVFGDASTLVDDEESRTRSSVEAIRAFAGAVLFSPIPVGSWGERERILGEAGVLVLPLQLLAFAAAADWFRSDRALLALDPSWPRTYPPSLRANSAYWVARQADPSPEEVETLLFELELYLGETRMQWLCACAAFPSPSWPITLGFADYFAADEGGRLAGLVALSALPWFRHGAWPRWLREALAGSLRPENEEVIRADIQSRLDGATIAPEARLAERLADVWREPDLRTRARRWWNVLRGRGSVLDRPLSRDLVFMGLMQPRMARALTTIVPKGLRRLFFREGLPVMGLQWPLVAFLVGLAVAVLALQSQQVRQKVGLDVPRYLEAPVQPDPISLVAVVVLEISPWGEILIDGKPKGVTPPMKSLSLEPGKYKIEVQNTIFPAHIEALELKAGDRVTVRHTFTEEQLATRSKLAEPGHIVFPEPPLFVFLDRIERFNVPASGFDVPSGKHMISVDYGDGVLRSEDVEVAAGQKLRLRPPPPPEPKQAIAIVPAPGDEQLVGALERELRSMGYGVAIAPRTGSGQARILYTRVDGFRSAQLTRRVVLSALKGHPEVARVSVTMDASGRDPSTNGTIEILLPPLRSSQKGAPRSEPTPSDATASGKPGSASGTPAAASPEPPPPLQQPVPQGTPQAAPLEQSAQQAPARQSPPPLVRAPSDGPTTGKPGSVTGLPPATTAPGRTVRLPEDAKQLPSQAAIPEQGAQQAPSSRSAPSKIRAFYADPPAVIEGDTVKVCWHVEATRFVRLRPPGGGEREMSQDREGKGCAEFTATGQSMRFGLLAEGAVMLFSDFREIEVRVFDPEFVYCCAKGFSIMNGPQIMSLGDCDFLGGPVLSKYVRAVQSCGVMKLRDLPSTGDGLRQGDTPPEDTNARRPVPSAR